MREVAGDLRTPALGAVAWLTAVVRVALHQAGLAHEPRLDEARDLLSRARGDLPRKIRVEHRHAVDPGRSFKMAPGFANIHAVSAGTLLAHDGDREVRAARDGLVLLPLYQPQGADGFFFGQAA